MNYQNIIITVLFLTLHTNLKGQEIFYNKNEYDIALRIYKDKLDSYNNYIRKHDLFADPKIAANTHVYFDSLIWFSYYLPFYAKRNIFYDCPILRYKSNVKPLKEEWVNYVKDPLNNKTIITIDDSLKSNSFFNGVYYRFDHPGKAPILISNVRKKLNPDFNFESREGSLKAAFKYNAKLDFYKDKKWDGMGRPKYLYIKTTGSASSFITELEYNKIVSMGKILIIDENYLSQNEK